MSEFSRILELYEELLTTVKLQQFQINELRRAVTQHAQTIYAQAPQQETKKQEAA
ncbi:hypothetical protein MO867_17920 [Microbulbifer sp. OS29]|uniref:Uncharacterized protein n=1 Tax=Microbulbifer okhotskensis TaxID=2926617 RepID=A0A9X2J934_9GAMM|nr:hypothetical protein [Microbulbifer okhotskensis]MCO1336211.1 hypothetical protein [Microbulbifer okhotskensis]